MQLRMWMYDLAREQSPTLDHLRTFCRQSVESGYNALGLYLEHRFAYPSAPWGAGKGALTPEMVRVVEDEFPTLQIIPFINLLGHCEGFLYTEEGHSFAEEPMVGMQACPSNPAFVQFAHKLVKDTLTCFKSPIIHIGGDETWQLGCCPKCRARVEEAEREERVDGKARLYGQHFAPMAQQVVEAGRRPAVWGDMFIDHPQALPLMPKETLIFDWQYFGTAKPTSSKFIEEGHDVVLCPSLQVYNATWFHVLQSEQNVRQHAEEAQELNAYGVCLTTWECGVFGAYDSLLPAIRASGNILAGKTAIASLAPSVVAEINGEEEAIVPLGFDPADSLFLKEYSADSEMYEPWARMMGVDLQQFGGPFTFTGTRSSLKCRLLLYSNPFLAWLHHAEELGGDTGPKLIAFLAEALAIAPNEAAKGVTIVARSAVEFVQIAEVARQEYSAGRAEGAISKLFLTRQIFDNLAQVARKTRDRIGGSEVDIERCRVAREHVDRVIVRIRNYGDRQLGYLPSFEQLTSPKFIPRDQAAWWLINKWGDS
jgi:hypothetical protein